MATSPLYAASLHGDPVAVGLLLDAGADPNEESPGHSEGTPLCAAAAWGNSDVVAALLAAGADPDRREDRGTGTSPLLWASRNGHVTTAHLLLEAGADPDLAVQGVTPLCAAAERGSLAIVTLLVQHGADVERRDGAGRTALRIAQEWSGRPPTNCARRMSRSGRRLRHRVGVADGAAWMWRRASMAATELQAIVRFRFHDGDVEEFKRLSAQCMEVVRNQDTGTLQYDTFFNDDETECIVVERFRDSDALIQHGENLAHLMDAIIATGSVSGELLGEPSEELRARITPGGPVQLFTPWSRL